MRSGSKNISMIKMKSVINKLALIMGISLVCMLASVQGQNGKYGTTPEDSVKCIEALNLYGDDVKAKNYKEAYPNWRIAVNTCPKAGKSLYINGSKMLKAFIKEEADEVKNGLLVDSLLWLYDVRIENFGQEGYVKGRKSGDVLKYKKDIDAAFLLAGESYEIEKLKNEINDIQQYL